MSNRIKYNFDDFTHASYRAYLKKAKENYVFRFYSDFSKEERFVLWRHDVDFSVHSAYELAKIENEESIKATYFLHLHNEFYNLFEKEIVVLVNEIIKMGHQIGIHFDTHFYNIQKENEIESTLIFEKNIIEKLFNIKVFAFSFHNTTPFILSCTRESYGNLINTYSAFFQNKIAYCSDSNGFWRYRRLHGVLDAASDRQLQVLTHPAWWTKEVLSPKERIWRCIDGRAENTKRWYDHIIISNGRENIDW